MPEGKPSKLNFILLGNIYFELSFCKLPKKNEFTVKCTLFGDGPTPMIRRKS